MTQDINKVKIIWNNLIKCYKSINDSLKELQLEIENKTIKFKPYYNDNNQIFDDDPNDELFVINIINNIFYFYYNSWNIFKKKCLKDLQNFNYWLQNKKIKKDSKLCFIPNFNDFENIFISITNNLDIRYENSNIKSDNNFIENFKYHDFIALNEKLKRIISYHNNIWINHNNNLIDELVFYNIDVNKKTIRYFNNLNINLQKKNNIKNIKNIKSRDITKKYKNLKQQIKDLKQENVKLANSSLDIDDIDFCDDID